MSDQQPLSKEMLEMLRQIQSYARSAEMTDPSHMRADVSDTAPFDFILGRYGIVDLANTKRPLVVWEKNTTSLPPSSPVTPSESPERVETAEEAFGKFLREEGCHGSGDAAHLIALRAGFEAGWLRGMAAIAGYEAGRKAK